MNATREWPGLGCRVILGLVFAAAGLHAAANPPEEFAAVMEAYYILPDRHLPLLAILIPWGELILGTFLIAGYLTRACAAAIAGMLALFEAALLSTQLRGIPLDHCGCFGSWLTPSPRQAMLLDLVLLGMAAAAFHLGHGRLSLDHWVERGIDPGGGT